MKTRMVPVSTQSRRVTDGKTALSACYTYASGGKKSISCL